MRALLLGIGLLTALAAGDSETTTDLDVLPTTAPTTPKPWAPTAEEIAAITALADEAVRLGLPDARGKTIRSGWYVFRRADEDRRSGNPGQGLLIELGKGLWWDNLGAVVVTDDTLTIDVKQCSEETPNLLAQLPLDDESVHRHRPDSDDLDALRPVGNDERFIASFIPADRPRIRACLADPTFIPDSWCPDDQDVRALVLIRAGVPGVAARIAPGMRLMPGWPAVSLAGFPGGDEGIRRPFETGIPNLRQIMDAWNRKTKSYQLKPFYHGGPGTVRLVSALEKMRESLRRWFQCRLASSRCGGFPAERLVAAIRALLPADGAAEENVNLDRFLAGLALPETIPEGADLATRLTVWRAKGGLEAQAEVDLDALLESDMVPASSRAHGEFSKEYAAHLARKKSDFHDPDIGGLIALVGDTRPTRWFDGGRCYGVPVARTVGDNALRALTRIFGLDPRLFVGRDPAAPWIDSERSATAAALVAWWKPHAGKTAAEVLTQDLARLPLNLAAQRLTGEKDPAQRTRQWAAIAQHFATARPDDLEPIGLAAVLRLAADDPAIAAIVAKWPVAGRHHLLLAAWHDLKGRPAALDALLSQEWSAAATPLRHDAVATAMRRPSAARLAGIRAVLSSDLNQPQNLALIASLIGSNGWLFAHQELELLLDENAGNAEAIERRYETMRAAIAAILLDDTRLFPPGTLTIEPPLDAGGTARSYPQRRHRIRCGTTWMHMFTADDRSAPKHGIEAWRICDFTAFNCGYFLNQAMGVVTEHIEPRFDLNADLATRDRILGVLRRKIAIPLAQRLKDAGLAAAPARDDKQR